MITSVKPHIHYLTAKTPSAIAKDFKKSSLIFLSLYLLISFISVGIIYFNRTTLDLEIIIPLLLITTLAFGVSILPKVYETAKMLNEKGLMDIAPSLLVTLQFVLNITFTTFIIPIFLWSKCDEAERRRQSRHQ